jgi:hypothetical protein
MSIATAAFRTVDSSERLPEAYVNAYYIDDLKQRIAVARVTGKLYAFDDLCSHDACPLSSGPPHRTDAHVPVRRVLVRRNNRRRAARTNDRAARNVRGSRAGRPDRGQGLSSRSSNRPL